MFSPAIQNLLRRRAELNAEIEREQQALNPDWPRIHRLKKWRLALKDILQGMAFSSPHGLLAGPAPVLIPAPVQKPALPPRPSRRPGRVRRLINV